MSPNWPKPYSPSTDCTWHIQAPVGHRLELIVKNFTLENYIKCYDFLDYLEIRYENDTNSSKLLTLVNSLPPILQKRARGRFSPDW